MATPAQKTAAKALVQAFKSGPDKGVWRTITKAELVPQITARIDDPDLIDQEGAPLCGPATTIRVLALDDPEQYAQAIIDLFVKGEAKVGQLEIEPRWALRQVSPAGGTAAADWILAASIRDSDNYLFTLHFLWWERQLAGITLPGSVVSWFEKMGYSDIVDRSHLVKPNQSLLEVELREANQLFGEGYHLCLLIDGALMSEATQENQFSAWPTHWIGLKTPISIARSGGRQRTVSLQCYSWGDTYDIPENAAKPVGLRDFLGKYYGFVAARH